MKKGATTEFMSLGIKGEIIALRNEKGSYNRLNSLKRKI